MENEQGKPEVYLRALKPTLLELRRMKPKLFPVMEAFIESGELVRRDCESGEPKYEVRVYRGFYVDLARRLQVAPNTVKKRLKSAIEWFVKQVRARADLLDKGPEVA